MDCCEEKEKENQNMGREGSMKCKTFSDYDRTFSFES
jgi:hypothetical protein